MSYWHYIASKSVLLALHSEHSTFLGTRFRPRSEQVIGATFAGNTTLCSQAPEELIMMLVEQIAPPDGDIQSAAREAS